VGLYGALAAGAFCVSVGLMWLAYRSILVTGLCRPELELRRRAMTRWVVVVLGIQLLLGACIAAYLVLTTRAGVPALGRALPPLGAVLGNALALQLAVFRLARSLRA